MRFFTVVKYMVKIFCSILIKMSSQIFTFYIFYRLENSLYFMKHDAEVKIFHSDRNRYI